MRQRGLNVKRAASMLGARPQPPYRVDASSADFRLLDATMQESHSWPRYEEIAYRQESELDEVISKPWGHEYRIYCDPFYDVWRLTLEPGQSTSEHCHPRKTTALICLSGHGRLNLLTGSYALNANDIVVIGRGVFHLTQNTDDEQLEVIEIEAPRNKFDLVRAEDSYGRRGQPYSDPPIDQISVPRMIAAPLLENARYRRTCASGRSRFNVVGGDHLPDRYAGDASLYVALLLSTSCALTDSITLLASASDWPSTINPHGVYFTIFSAAPRIRPTFRAVPEPAKKTSSNETSPLAAEAHDASFGTAS